MGIDQGELNRAVVPIAPSHRAVAEGHGSSSDEAAHLDGRLMHELSAVNYHLGLYVLRYYDADAGRVEPVPAADELALANSVAAAADAIRARVARRECQDEEPQ
jgi:hypothetical protein